MGRSFLSVKLAVAFGLCVAVLVTGVERVRAAGADCDRTTAETEATAPATPGKRASAVPIPSRPAAAARPAEQVVCLWRACPGDLAPIRPVQRPKGRQAVAVRA